MIERNQRILSLPSASNRDISSLRNWVEYTGSIARGETEFLDQNDILTTNPSGNDALATIAPRVEDIVIAIYQFFSKVCFSTLELF